MCQHSKKLTHMALTGLLALTASALSGCGSNSQPIVCKGMVKANPTLGVLMPSGECSKIAGGTDTPATASALKHYKPESYNTYVKCYGIAAGSKNDCGTKTTACAGTMKQARASDAWIAIPKATCLKVGGKPVEPTKQGQWHPFNAIKKDIL